MNKLETVFEQIFETLELGTIKEITYVNSSQNLVHKVITDKKAYYVKQYSKDAIKNDKDLLKRKRQIAVTEKLSENGVPAILPLSFNNRYFIKYKKDMAAADITIIINPVGLPSVTIFLYIKFGVKNDIEETLSILILEFCFINWS